MRISRYESVRRLSRGRLERCEKGKKVVLEREARDDNNVGHKVRQSRAMMVMRTIEEPALCTGKSE